MGAAAGHPLLGRQLALSSHPDARLWEQELDTNWRPYLEDHQVQGETVLPATTYLELAAAAAIETFGDEHVVLERVNFRRVLLVPKGSALTLQVALTITAPGTATFQVASRQAGGDSAAWTIHADGHIRHTLRTVRDQPVIETPAAVRARCAELLTSAELYAGMEAQGLSYGRELSRGRADLAARRRGSSARLACRRLLPKKNRARKSTRRCWMPVCR